ncbi:MAG TPA: PIN domain-containing protein [Hyphomicrobiaceae bacterium]|nr:PIN domain-containing protein [Hyphomicrobiaceae bacterium]
MSLFVDTNVWSELLRRDSPRPLPEVEELSRALDTYVDIYTTGIVLQEVLQGITGPKHKRLVLEHFEPLKFVRPERADHVAAAELRNSCRRAGVQVQTIDALLAQICIRNGLMMLSLDGVFLNMTKHVPLRMWQAQ